MAGSPASSPQARKQTHDRWLTFTVVAVVALFALFIAAMWRLGFFNFTGDDPSSKVVAAAVALVGALFGSLITLLGLVLKHSVDERSLALQAQAEERLRVESARNSQLAADAEARLKLEAAIQAVGLLGGSGGKEPPPIQRAGVILALGSLGMYPLAISLTDQMLATRELYPGTACWLFNEALASPNLYVSTQAAIITQKYAARMLLPDGEAVFPAILLGEEYLKLPDEVRPNGAFALVDMVLARKYQDWTHTTFCNVLSSLHLIWKRDPDDSLREVAGIALATFVRALPPEEMIGFEPDVQAAGQILAELEHYDGLSLGGKLYAGKERALAMREWAEALKPKPAADGPAPP